MKGSEQFTTAIESLLTGYCAKDPLFIEKYNNPNKNIKDCVTYIINEVKKTGNNAFAPEDILQLAIHYYDEEDIKVGNRPKGSIVSPTTAKMSVVKKKSTTQNKAKPIIQDNGQLQMF